MSDACVGELFGAESVTGSICFKSSSAVAAAKEALKETTKKGRKTENAEKAKNKIESVNDKEKKHGSICLCE